MVRRVRAGRKARLRFTPRALIELGSVYERPEEVVRELIQNAVDSGAKRVWVDVAERGGRKYLIFRHDGRPIEGEELRAFLTVGTDYKARRGGAVGFWGIGRLAWLMVGDEARIYTGDKELVWRAENPLEIGVNRLEGGKYVDGVMWVIRVRPDREADVTPESLSGFVASAYAGPAKVFVNGKAVARRKKGLKPLFDDGRNRVFFSPEDEFAASIYREGFKIGDDSWLPYLVIHTRDERVRINPSRHIVRDASYTAWRREIARSAVKALRELLDKRKIPPETYARAANRMLSNLFFLDLKDPIWGSALLRVYTHGKRRKWVFLEDVLRNPGKFLWIDEDDSINDTSLSELRRRGMTVVVAPNSEVREILKGAGVRNAGEYMITESYAVDGALSERSKRLSEIYRDFISKAIEEALKEDEEVEAELRKKARPPEGPAGGSGGAPASGGTYPVSVGKGGEVEARIIAEGGNVILRGRTIGVVKAKIVGKAGDLPVMFVRGAGDVLAFTDGRNIYINADNPEVRKMIELSIRKRLKPLDEALLWAPIIIHEELHRMGLDHHNRLWGPTYETIMRRFIRRYLERVA